ncbi:MAG: 50S ribosomal protein L18 [Deltaproteobacteria bacterium]|nr:50S ribosomal protein L18 [Deltaproteobacteria bacterium]
MTAAPRKLEGRERRKLRIRKSINGTTERPRLSVFRSARHIYVQVIDDTTGKTLASASTMSKDLRSNLDGTKSDEAKKVGALIAEMCKSKSIDKVVFDRNGYRYHGRIKALADAAREAGLNF